MERHRIIDTLEGQLGLSRQFIYVLDLVPLISAMWADGHNSDQEIDLILKFLHERRKRLDVLSYNDEHVLPDVTVEEFCLFLRDSPMDNPVFNDAYRLALSFLTQSHSLAIDHKDRVLQQCLEVAAVAVDPVTEKRVSDEERAFITQLVNGLYS